MAGENEKLRGEVEELEKELAGRQAAREEVYGNVLTIGEEVARLKADTEFSGPGLESEDLQRILTRIGEMEARLEELGLDDDAGRELGRSYDLARLEARLEELEARLGMASKSLEELDGEIGSMKKELDSKSKQIEANEEAILDSRLDEARRLMDSLPSRINLDNLDQARRDYDQLVRTLDGLEASRLEELGRLEELEELGKDIEALEKLIQDKDSNDRDKKELALELEKKALELEAARLEKTDLEAKLLKSEEKLADLEEKLSQAVSSEEYQKLEADLKEEKSKLREEKAKQEQAEASLIQAQAEVARLKADLKATVSREEYQALEKELDEKTQAYLKLSQANSQLKTELDKSKASIAGLNTSIDSIEKERKQAQAEVDRLKAELKVLDSENQGNIQENKELRKELASKEAALKDLEAGKKDLEEQIKASQEELNQSQADLDQAQEEITGLKTEQASKDKEIEKLTSEIAELKKANGESGKENTALKEELASKEAALEKLEADKEKLGKQIQTSQKELEQRQADLDQAQEEITGLKTEQASKEEKIVELTSQIAKLNEKNQASGKENTALKEKLASKEAALKDLEVGKEKLKKEKADLESNNESLETKVKDLEAKIKGLEGSALNKENQKLKIEIALRDIAAVSSFDNLGKLDIDEDIKKLEEVKDALETKEKKLLEKLVEDYKSRIKFANKEDLDTISAELAADSNLESKAKLEELIEKRSQELETQENAMDIYKVYRELEVEIEKLMASLDGLEYIVDIDSGNVKRAVGEARKGLEKIDKTAEEKNLGDMTVALRARIESLEVKLAGLVDKKISELPGEITLESKELVEAARAAYDVLTEDQKKLVKNLDTLIAAENKIKELEEEKAEAERQAKLVTDTLADIKSAESLEVLEAIAIDESLSEENKATLNKAKADKKVELEAAKLEADKKAAQVVEDQIGALGEISLESKEAVGAARAAYDLLTDEQKALVNNLETLEEAEASIKELEEAKAEADRQAEIVEKTLGEIKSAETLEILEVIKIEDTLSEANKKTLVDAKNNKKVELEAAKAKADKEAAEAVENQIEILGEISLDSKEAVEAARVAYDDLTAEQKELVTNLGTLTAAEAKIKELEEAKAKEEAKAEEERQAKVVTDTLADIKSAESLEVLEAIAIDESLSEENKATLNKAKADKKVELEAAKLEADKKAAQVVEDQIGALGEISLDSKEAVEAARAAYDALTPEQKNLVKNIGTLEAAETKIKELEKEKADKEAAEAVDKQISELSGEVSLGSKGVVEVARGAFDKLTEEQKKLVNNLETLEEAEARIKDLEKIEETKEKAISEVKTEYPEANYSKNKAEYDEAIARIDEAKSLDEIEAKKSEAMDLISKLYTDSEADEVEKIDGHLSSNMESTIKSTNNQAKSKGFKVSYLYDDHNKLYEVAIDKSQENTSVLGTMGKGFATGLINPLTMGSKSGSVVNNIPENLISNTVTALDDSGKSHEFDRDHLSNLTSDTKAFGVFMPEGQSASPFAKLKILVGQSYRMEYKYKLSSGREYTNNIVIKFTNDYKE